MTSIIIPTYNRAQSLNRAIQSVLNQTYKNFELIIVDDGSKDNTEEVVKNFHDNRIKYFRHDVNLGGSSARNTGIKRSTGKYVAFLDSDDEWLEGKLESQVRTMESRPSDVWGGVYCGFSYTTGKGEVIEAIKCGNLKKDLLNLEVGMCAGSTFLVSKSVINDIGLFDESFKRHQDWEYLVRFFRKYKILAVREPLVKIDGHRIVKGVTLAEVKEQYLSKFETDINELDEDIAQEIRAKHWLSTSIVFASELNYSESFKYLKRSLQYKVLPLWEYCILLYQPLKGLRNRYIKMPNFSHDEVVPTDF
jgi:glycosyltransferase involved in cell wall biosynthesis